MIAFANAFLSYLLLFVIMAAVAGTGIFIGITLRRRKNLKDAETEGLKEE